MSEVDTGFGRIRQQEEGNDFVPEPPAPRASRIEKFVVPLGEPVIVVEHPRDRSQRRRDAGER